MNKIILNISESHPPLRLDKIIQANCDKLSRREIKLIIGNGGVFINRRRIRRVSQLITPPVRIEIYIERQNQIKDIGHQIHWHNLILFSDSDLLVINKPAGIVTAPTRFSVKNNIYYYLREANLLPSVYYPFHRLDKNTSGVLLIPLSKRMTQSLNTQMRERHVCKKYWAIATGKPPTQTWSVSGNISRKGSGRSVFIFVPQPKETAANSFTEFSTMAYNPILNTCLIEAHPFTGRTHQIRLHLHHSHLPIFGDHQYNPNPVPQVPVKLLQPVRQMLHSRETAFWHPNVKDQITVQAPLPEDFNFLIRQFFPDLTT